MLPSERRLTQHILIRRARAEWVQSDCWVPRFASAAVDSAFMGGLSPWQRSTLGLPPPGNSRWDRPTLAATAARYAGFDPAPYTAAVTTTALPGHLSAAGHQPESLVFATDEEVRLWHNTGWVVLDSAERLWPADALSSALRAAAATPVPGYSPSQQSRLRPNGAMGGPPLADAATPFVIGDAGASSPLMVESLGELPFDDGGPVDALAFAPSAVLAVAEMMACLPEDVRLCRSELVGIVPPPPPPRDNSGGNEEEQEQAEVAERVVSLWQPQQYSLLASDWDPHRRTDGVACLLVHSSSAAAASSAPVVPRISIETNGEIRELPDRPVGTTPVVAAAAAAAVVLFDVTLPHRIRIPQGWDTPVLCSILLWRRRDAGRSVPPAAGRQGSAGISLRFITANPTRTHAHTHTHDETELDLPRQALAAARTAAGIQLTEPYLPFAEHVVDPPDWIGWEAWGKKLSGYTSLSSPAMGALQRGVLGWPAVGSDYWRREGALEGAERRYGKEAVAVYSAARM